LFLLFLDFLLVLFLLVIGMKENSFSSSMLFLSYFILRAISLFTLYFWNRYSIVPPPFRSLALLANSLVLSEIRGWNDGDSCLGFRYEWNWKIKFLCWVVYDSNKLILLVMNSCKLRLSSYYSISIKSGLRTISISEGTKSKSISSALIHPFPFVSSIWKIFSNLFTILV